MHKLSFNKRLLSYLIIGFVVSTIAGTVSHELGHYGVAKALGYDAHINYGSTHWEDTNFNRLFDTAYKKFPQEMEKGLDFPNRKLLEKWEIKQNKDSLWILLGGSMQTMLTGSIGLFCLLLLTRKKDESFFHFKDWFLVFVSLFWLRQPANMFTWLFGFIIKGKFSEQGDEVKIALHLGMPFWSIILMTALLGALVLSIVLFRVIPKHFRNVFILSGLVGGVLGYFIWLYWLGPILMP